MAGFHFARPADDHGDADAAFVEKLFSADVAAAVVADEEDEGIVGKAFVIEALEDGSDFAVDKLHLLEAVGPVAANEGSVGIVRGKLDLLGIDGALGIAIPETMGAAEGDAGKEGLSVFALVPVGSLEELILAVREKIAVGFPAEE